MPRKKAIIEVRCGVPDLEIRTDAGKKTLTGYAVKWNQPSQDLGFIEKVQRGAFSDSLQKQPVRLLREHKPELLLASTNSKTLTLSEDSNGLRFTAVLGNSSVARDLVSDVKENLIAGMSFGFQVQKDTWGSDGSTVTRSLEKCVLHEISACADPAYLSTSINVRNVPREFRSLIKRSGDTDVDCECDCEACLDGDCTVCSDADCDLDACTGCPMQSEERSLLEPEPEDIERYMRLQLKLRR